MKKYGFGAESSHVEIKPYGWGFNGIDTASAEYIIKECEALPIPDEKDEFEALVKALRDYEEALRSYISSCGCGVSQSKKVLEQLQRTIVKISSGARGTDFADDINEKSFTENFCLPGISTYKNLPASRNSPPGGSTMRTEAASPEIFNTDLFCFEKSFIPDSDDRSTGSSFVADVKHLIEELNTSDNAVADGELQKEYLQRLRAQFAQDTGSLKSRHAALEKEVKTADALQHTRELQLQIRAEEDEYGAKKAGAPTVDQLKEELKRLKEWNKKFEQIWDIKTKQ
ncbi:MAG: hypothetical protein JWR25_1787 [Noviherbaspirillum sp.]|nr:hypothetical protein [Noviherbaspirillum sp.]